MAQQRLPAPRSARCCAPGTSARETGAPGAALLGTVIVERVIDAIVRARASPRSCSGSAARRPPGSRRAPCSFPLLAHRARAARSSSSLLRLWPEAGDRARRRASWAGCSRRPPSDAARDGAPAPRGGPARRSGGGAPLAWVAFYSVAACGSWSRSIPFAATLWSLGIDLGSPQRVRPGLLRAPHVGRGGGRDPLRPGLLRPLPRRLLGRPRPLRGAQGDGDRPRHPRPRGLLAHHHRGRARSCCAPARRPSRTSTRSLPSKDPPPDRR